MWIMVGQGPTVFVVGASWGGLNIYSPIMSLVFLPLSGMDG